MLSLTARSSRWPGLKTSSNYNSRPKKKQVISTGVTIISLAVDDSAPIK